MAFRESCRMEERIKMLIDYDSGLWSVSDLCRRYGVSRETFYVWKARRSEGDEAWFMDRSHAPKTVWLQTPAHVVAQIVALRRRFPHLGPRKLLAVREREDGAHSWPSASTIGDILAREGLVEKKRRRR